jgi:AbrB family looped-hinge helix DNA binding protein
MGTPANVNPPKRYTILVGNKGRVILPAEVRRHCGLAESDRLLLHVEKDGSIHLLSARGLAHNLKGMFKELHPEQNWADEFIEQRRQEARRESGGE